MLMQYNTYIEIQLKEQPERDKNLEVATNIDLEWSLGLHVHTYQGKDSEAPPPLSPQTQCLLVNVSGHI